MIDGPWLAGVLEETPGKIDAWRSQALQLKHLVTTAEITGKVSDELLQSAEATCTSIYAEMVKCAEVIETVAATSQEAASQLAGLGDTLRLVLLEITELITELYAVRSRLQRPPISTLA
ncbi:MAG: hypothetical protein ABIO40_08450 [Devosia sp.]